MKPDDTIELDSLYGQYGTALQSFKVYKHLTEKLVETQQMAIAQGIDTTALNTFIQDAKDNRQDELWKSVEKAKEDLLKIDGGDKEIRGAKFSVEMMFDNEKQIASEEIRNRTLKKLEEAGIKIPTVEEFKDGLTADRIKEILPHSIEAVKEVMQEVYDRGIGGKPSDTPEKPQVVGRSRGQE